MDLDNPDALFVKLVLEEIAGEGPPVAEEADEDEEGPQVTAADLWEALPPELRAAMSRSDGQEVSRVMQGLPPTEQARVIQILQILQSLGGS